MEVETHAYFGKPAPKVVAEAEQVLERVYQKGCMTAVIAAGAAVAAQGDQKDYSSFLLSVETERAEAWEVRQKGQKRVPLLLAW